jgi:hypothetical protein
MISPMIGVEGGDDVSVAAVALTGADPSNIAAACLGMPLAHFAAVRDGCCTLLLMRCTALAMAWALRSFCGSWLRLAGTVTLAAGSQICIDMVLHLSSTHRLQ